MNIISKFSQYINDFFWKAIQHGSRQFVLFAIVFIAAKFLTNKEFGLYNYSVAIVYLFVLFSDFGISRAVIKYVAKYSIQDKNKRDLIFFNAGLVILVLSLIILLLIFTIGDLFFSNSLNHIYILLPTFFALPFTALFESIYTGRRKFRTLSIVSIVTCTISLTISFFLIKIYGLLGALYSLNFFYVLYLVLLAFSYKDYKIKFERQLMKEIISYSVIIGVASLGHFLYSKANIIILGKNDYLIEAGYFEIITKIFVITIFPFLIFGQIISPRVAELVAENRLASLKKYYHKILGLSIPVVLLVTLLVIFISPSLIEQFLPKYYNNDFLSMFYIYVIFLPPALISNAVLLPFIVPTGNAKIGLLTIPTGILNIILSLILISEIGFIAVVVSTVISSGLNVGVSVYLVHRQINKKLVY